MRNGGRSGMVTAHDPHDGSSGGSPAVRVLVVDDDPMMLEYVQLLLEALGFVVRTASSPAEAESVLKTWQPAVLLSDVNMPGGGAEALLGRLEEIGSKVRTILMTGGDLGCAQRAVRDGRAVAVLAKPFGRSLLVAVIGETVASIESARSNECESRTSGERNGDAVDHP